MEMDKQTELASAYEHQLVFETITGNGAHLSISLDPIDIQDERCRAFWSYAIKEKSIDIAEVETKFDRDGFVSEIVSGKLFINGNKTIAAIAKKIKQLSHRRKVHKSLMMATAMMEAGKPVNEVAEFAMAAFDNVKDDEEATHIKTLMGDAYHDLQEANEGKAINFVKTGMLDFDYSIGGLQQGGLIIIAGRPSMGKTAFVSKLSRNIAIDAPVLMFSMEMSGKQMAMRFLAAEKNVDLQLMMQGKLATEDWRKLADASSRLRELNIYINDKTSRSISDISAEARRFKRKHGKIGGIMIDYLTLLNLPDAARNDLAVGQVTRSAKNLAGELECPVCLLSQLNRSLENREDKRPRMSDLRDSGSIEQDADQIIFPYRDEVYNKKPENVGLAEAIVVKNRNGRTGTIKMSWLAKSATFKDMDKGI